MRIPIQTNEDNPEPLYYQIEQQLRALILNGQLEEGALLPSIREFAQSLSCSVITIRRVYQDLEHEGLLRTRQGTGTFVAKVGVDERDRFRRESVSEAFQTAVEAALRVNCQEGEIRVIFEEALKDGLSKRPENEREKGESDR